MAITHLGLHGSQKAYATFAPKTAPPGFTPAPKLTSLGLHGSMRAYATFSAKGTVVSSGPGGFWVFGESVVS